MRPFVANPEADRLLRQLAHAHVSLTKRAGDAVKTDALSGRLYFSSSGWLLLSVPNALGQGAFDALDEPGVELPTSGSTGRYNAHITVFRPEEIVQIGGPDRITERGHSYNYSLGPVVEIQPKNWDGVSKVWAIQVDSQDLKALRKSYGLSPLPNGDHEFHITFATRKTNVLRNNDVSKAAEVSVRPPRGLEDTGALQLASHEGPLSQFSALAVQGLRGTRDQNLCKVAEEFFGLLGGYGSGSSGLYAGEEEHQQALHAWQLQVGQSQRTEPEPLVQSETDRLRKNADARSVGRGDGDQVAHDSGEDRLLWLVGTRRGHRAEGVSSLASVKAASDFWAENEKAKRRTRHRKELERIDEENALLHHLLTQ